MQGQRSQLCFHVPGTLAANINIRWKAGNNFRIQKVSSVASNDSDATLELGISTDTNSILAAAVIGDSNVPVEKTRSDFVSTNPTGAVTKGEIVVITLDYDGAAGTAAADFTCVVTVLEG